MALSENERKIYFDVRDKGGTKEDAEYIVTQYKKQQMSVQKKIESKAQEKQEPVPEGKFGGIKGFISEGVETVKDIAKSGVEAFKEGSKEGLITGITEGLKDVDEGIGEDLQDHAGLIFSKNKVVQREAAARTLKKKSMEFLETVADKTKSKIDDITQDILGQSLTQLKSQDPVLKSKINNKFGALVEVAEEVKDKGNVTFEKLGNISKSKVDDVLKQKDVILESIEGLHKSDSFKNALEGVLETVEGSKSQKFIDIASEMQGLLTKLDGPGLTAMELEKIKRAFPKVESLFTEAGKGVKGLNAEDARALYSELKLFMEGLNPELAGVNKKIQGFNSIADDFFVQHAKQIGGDEAAQGLRKILGVFDDINPSSRDFKLRNISNLFGTKNIKKGKEVQKAIPKMLKQFDKQVKQLEKLPIDELSDIAKRSPNLYKKVSKFKAVGKGVVGIVGSLDPADVAELLALARHLDPEKWPTLQAKGELAWETLKSLPITTAFRSATGTLPTEESRRTRLQEITKQLQEGKIDEAKFLRIVEQEDLPAA